MAEAGGPKRTGDTKNVKSKQKDVRSSNLIAARGVADAIRTSLGPKGMDKMITSSTGDVVITNDGATILDKMEVIHPAAKMLVELSKSQDVEAGDGTTSVVVLCGALLEKSEELLQKGVHPTTIAESWAKAASKAEAILNPKDPNDVGYGKKVTLQDSEELVQAAITSLNSKVVSQYSDTLAPIAVKAVQAVYDPAIPDNVDLRDVRVVTKKGGTIEDTELVDGIVFTQNASNAAGGPTRIENAKVALIQFQLSAPKTNMENSVIVQNHAEIDRIARDERKYILKMVKKIAASGCNVLLIQKSILREAVNVLSLHYLAKKKIMVVTDVERDEVEFICKSLGCKPISDIERFSKENLGEAKLAEEVAVSSGRILKITGVKNPGKTVSILVRASNDLVLAEADRSLHDALCVVRCIVKVPKLIVGGGAPELELHIRLKEWARKELGGMEAYCIDAFADALKIIPYTLAENAGLHPIKIVSELERKHREGKLYSGINVKKACVSDMWKEMVIQPCLVSTSAINLATECVKMLLKIDDIIGAR